MDPTTRPSQLSEQIFSSFMSGWGKTKWGSNESEHFTENVEDEKSYHNCDYWAEEPQNINRQSSSSSFSLSSSSMIGSGLLRKEQLSAAIAACFLKDYEGGQPPTLSNNFSDISRTQLLLYRIKHSLYWKWFGLSLATIFLFIPSFNGRLLTFFLHAYSLLVFVADLYMKDQLRGKKGKVQMGQAKFLLFHSMKGFLLLMTLQTVIEPFLLNHRMVHAFSLAISVFKPIVFFYQSRRARDALEALIRISKKLFRVILIELFLILVFATVACRLYYDHDSFQSLPQSWLSLFACKFRGPFSLQERQIHPVPHVMVVCCPPLFLDKCIDMRFSVHNCGKSQYLDAYLR